MKIVCDKNMPLVAEAFGTLGDVTLRDGRHITRADVQDAEMLITRSTTRIHADLLDGSMVRFYGSGVIGTDHIDIPYLKERGIVWTGAPGCNAQSVANYVTAALLWLGGRYGLTLAGLRIGVIGVGHVGRRVCAQARALGMQVLPNDPPRQRDPADEAAREFLPLDQLMAEADVITCHVPLIRKGSDTTWHMLNAAAFDCMRSGVIVINAARGAVLDTDALLNHLGTKVSHAVIDCWEGEPAYRADLLAHADITTPHIAGHAHEGKVNGTAAVYRQACGFLGVQPSFSFALPQPLVPELRVDAEGRLDEDVLRDLVLRVYDIEADSRRLREKRTADDAHRAEAFDFLRGHYPMRREFSATRVQLTGAHPGLIAKVRGLGFRLDSRA